MVADRNESTKWQSINLPKKNVMNGDEVSMELFVRGGTANKFDLSY